MASLLDMPRPRGSGFHSSDSLLGIEQEAGMTDSSFQQMGRAPVDELWAGRFSAAVDDEEFMAAEEVANRTRDAALKYKEGKVREIYENAHKSGNPITMEQAEMRWMNDSRDLISNRSGLDLYPGHLRSDEKNPIFMTEFSDEGAAWRDGAMSTLKENGTSKPSFLADVLKHDELYRHYPEAQFLPVYANPDMEKGHGGSYYPQTMFSEDSGKSNFGQIVLNAQRSDEENLGTMIHELQHFIQSQEGWEGGGGMDDEITGAYIRDQWDYAKADDSPLTQSRAKSISNAVDTAHEHAGSDRGLFFEALNDMNLDYEAYAAMSGEALARDAESRWSDDAQIDMYYRGDEDRYDNENWYDQDASFMPNPVMPEVREMMQEKGLLGPMPGGFTPEVLSILRDEVEGKQGPIKREDPYLKAYQSLLGGL